jgi:hypothetical protein
MEDKTELFRTLAKSIRPAGAPLTKGSPIGEQFFAPDPAGIKFLDTATLAETMAGEPYNRKIGWLDAICAAGYSGIALNRPKIAGDVTRIGTGAGWVPPSKVTPASGAKAASARLEEALRKNALAKGLTTADADTAVLTALLAEIVKALIGVDPDTLDPGVVKTRFSAALKKAGPQMMATVAQITAELEEARQKASFESTGGKWVREGSHLSLSV